MPRPEGIGMLARRRGFYRDKKEIIRTPLLLPSFSSKGFPKVQSVRHQHL